jgi:hypothetical protein
VFCLLNWAQLAHLPCGGEFESHVVDVNMASEIRRR